jgi:hypothetical protein
MVIGLEAQAAARDRAVRAHSDLADMPLVQCSKCSVPHALVKASYLRGLRGAIHQQTNKRQGMHQSRLGKWHIAHGKHLAVLASSLQLMTQLARRGLVAMDQQQPHRLDAVHLTMAALCRGSKVQTQLCASRRGCSKVPGLTRQLHQRPTPIPLPRQDQITLVEWEKTAAPGRRRSVGEEALASYGKAKHSRPWPSPTLVHHSRAARWRSRQKISDVCSFTIHKWVTKRGIRFL